MATTRFVSVNLTPAARDQLRLASLHISMDLGRKVSMADALLVLNDVAQQHPEQIREAAARLITGSTTTTEE